MKCWMANMTMTTTHDTCTHTHESCHTKMLWNFQLVWRRVDIVWFGVHFPMKFANFHSKTVTLNLAQFCDGIDRDWWHLCVHKLLLAMSPTTVGTRPMSHGKESMMKLLPDCGSDSILNRMRISSIDMIALVFHIHCIRHTYASTRWSSSADFPFRSWFMCAAVGECVSLLNGCGGR